ncbi:MAG: hypothetical protein D6785_04375, partial [Planctomycetota bacterium]
MKSRLTHKAIAQFAGAAILGLIALSFFRSAYYQYFLYSNLSEAHRSYYSGPEYYETAITYLEDAQNQSKEYGPTYNLMGFIYLHPKKLRLSRAQEYFKKAIQYGPSNNDRYIGHIGMSLYWIGKALSLREKGEEKKEKKGENQSKVKEYFQSAEEELDRAAQYSGNKKDHLFYQWALFSIQGAKGKRDSLFKEIQSYLSEEQKESIPSRGALVTYFYELGLLLAQKEKYQESIRILRTAFRLDPKNLRISQALGNILVKLLQSKSPNDSNQKSYVPLLEKIMIVEECIGLSLDIYSKNLLGLDPFLDVISAELAYRYSELAVLMSHELGWFGDLKKLPKRYSKFFLKFKIDKVSLLEKREKDLFKKATFLARKLKNKANISNVNILLLKAKALQNWLQAVPKDFKNNYYSESASVYRTLASIPTLPPSLRSQAYANSAYYYIKIKKFPQAETNVRLSLKYDDTNPVGYYNLAVAFDKSKVSYHKKKAIQYYQKGLE